MTVLDTNIVGIVLPTIARDLNASFADIEWVISAYVLCFAALLLPSRASRNFGVRASHILGGRSTLPSISGICVLICVEATTLT